VEREVALVLEDDGPGIEAQDLEKITQPFFTTKSRGTGLGLPIAQKNVEAHGGKLQIESEVGRGTRVLISLPAGRQT
jgi:signal transduction histidine kinase